MVRKNVTLNLLVDTDPKSVEIAIQYGLEHLSELSGENDRGLEKKNRGYYLEPSMVAELDKMAYHYDVRRSRLVREMIKDFTLFPNSRSIQNGRNSAKIGRFGA